MLKSFKEIWHSIIPKERNYLKLGFFIIILLGLVSIGILPLLLTLPAPFQWMDLSHRDSVATTINGISMPFITIGIGCLAFLAFWTQYKANKQQTKQFEKQDKDTKKDRFENKYYKLLDLHRSNIDNMTIGNHLSGRKCFVPMFYEFRFCFVIVSDYLKSYSEIALSKDVFSKINALDFSYRLFFFGIGFNSEKQLHYYFTEDEKQLYNDCKGFLEKIQDNFLEFINKNPTKTYFTFNSPLAARDDERTIDLYYFPFDGHADKLGYYYRHLFQTVGYVVNQPADFITKEEKYEYLKTLRAQLSNYEQLMLYYNSLTIGKAWLETEYFRYYRMIKNLPLPLADFGEDPEEFFKEDIKELKKIGIDMFEWEKG